MQYIFKDGYAIGFINAYGKEELFITPIKQELLND